MSKYETIKAKLLALHIIPCASKDIILCAPKHIIPCAVAAVPQVAVALLLLACLRPTGCPSMRPSKPSCWHCTACKHHDSCAVAVVQMQVAALELLPACLRLTGCPSMRPSKPGCLPTRP